jgi:hypothetical protein
MDTKERIKLANRAAADCVIKSDPVLVDILPAEQVITGISDQVILHSGPPIPYADMVPLHQRGMISAMLFEGWAKNPKEADERLRAGEIEIDSALNRNTVGAGTGIITRSVAMMVVEDRTGGKRAATFPAEGSFQGGFCGWGLYSPEIAENLRYMREELLIPLRDMLRTRGGVSIKPILAEGFQMGDENHTRQTAVDMLFLRQILMDMLALDIPKETLVNTLGYIVNTPRFFHCLGQGASRACMMSAEGIEWSTMVTAIGGNGSEFGIQVAGLPGQWFTAQAPKMQGNYTSSRYSEKDQLPWMGDSCVVECAGMGGLAAAASPIVCNLRGMTMQQAVGQTREMEQICIAKNYNFPIPNMDFNFLPVGIDIRLVLKTGISPVIHGGMFGHDGGLIGAGSARVPMLCFEKAMQAFAETYGGRQA